jgi:hypothetical protein
MNSKIKELAEQAGIEFDDDFSLENELIYYVNQTELTKFAELIVRECIQVCKSRVANHDYNTGRMHSASDIKDHFGLK